MRSRRWMAAAFALGAQLGACSFVGARREPHRNAAGEYECASYVAPTGDLLVLTPITGFATMLALINYSLSYDDPSPLPPIGLGLATAAAVASSIYGYGTIAGCRARLRELEDLNEGD